ncbi:MAG: PIN domain-containing protein [Planctomycetes bacterium]|nr:PIN domain-containing protein [Planctomycetota bacterium]
MFVLDTDTLTHLLMGHKKVTARRAETDEQVTRTIITRIEVVQGRFASVLKAEDGEKLVLAQNRLLQTEDDLENFMALSIDAAVASEFDRLREDRKLKIRRGDMLIAAIVLANRATLVTRNEKDFRKVPGLRIVNWVD